MSCFYHFLTSSHPHSLTPPHSLMTTETLPLANAKSTYQPVEVPLIFNDLKKNLTLKDVLHSLTTLNTAFDHTVGRLEARVAQERDRITHINTRTAICLSE
jgi:hypothetical protein